MASARWSTDALKDLEKIDFPIVERIVEKTNWLEKNFATVVPEKLHRELADLYKLRVGDYRVIYSIRGDVIFIQSVRHRRDVYR